MATAPIIELPVGAVVVWCGRKYYQGGGFEHPYWKRKRSRLEVTVRWALGIILLGPLITYFVYRARHDASFLIAMIALLAAYLWMRRKAQ
jgi:hypothetical protein